MRRLPAGFILGFVGLECLYLRIARLEDLRQHASAFLVYIGIAFLIFLGVVWLLLRNRRTRSPRSRWVLTGLLIGAAVFRLTLVGLTPTLSDDVHRYVWDGRLQVAGISPYRYAPSDEAVADLRDGTWQLMNHKDLPTVYPPLMQGTFRLGAWIAPTVMTQKLVFLCFDLAIIGLLVVWLVRVGKDPCLCLIYAWHPLVVVEVAGSGHNDPLGVFWMVLGLVVWEARHRMAATVAFALAFLSKLMTILLWPFYWLRQRTLFGLFLGVIALGYLPFWGSPNLIVGVGNYGQPWEFNSSLHAVLSAGLGQPLLVRGLLMLLVVLAGLWFARRTEDLTHYTLRMLQTMMLIAPVLEPWYLLWLIPLLCLRFSWVWLVFSGLVLLSYMVLVRFVHDGIWQLPLWVQWVEYTPVYAWLVWMVWRRWAPQRVPATV